MTGLLNIHPDGESTINISTIDNQSPSDTYELVFANLNESDRQKILYSEESLGGRVTRIESALSDISLSILVAGDTPEEIASNAAGLQTAFANRNGGYIEYRPPGYSSSILTTFYRYLMSGPPVVTNPTSVHQAPTAAKIIGQLYRFNIKIFALATGDPESPVTIVSTTAINNYNPGYVKVPDSSIKGDGLIPIVDFSMTGFGGVNQAILSAFPMDDAALGDDFGFVVDTGDYSSFDASGRYQWSSKSTGFIRYNIPINSTKSFGRVVPLCAFKVASGGGQWQVRVLLRMGTLNYTPVTDWRDVVYSSPTIWEMTVLDTMSYPLLQLPITIGDMSALGATSVQVEFRTKDTSSYTMNFYGLVLAPMNAGSWIVKFDNSDDFAEDMSPTIDLHVDAVSGTSYTRENTGSLYLSQSWSKNGMPIRDLILPKGTDYQLRSFLYDYTVTGYHHLSPTTPFMKVRGIFYTVYPFSET